VRTDLPQFEAETEARIRQLYDYTRDEEYPEVVVLKDLIMTTRDGYKLTADAYVPARGGVAVEGTFPVILDRTPYDKNIRAHLVNDPEYIVKRGYVFVFQDTRGHGGSEGEFSLFGTGHDGADGYDAVEWLADQPWSNGDVATCGWSADCISQLILGVERPPHLKAMYLGHGPSNYFQELAGQNGAMRLVHGITYSFRNALLDRQVKADPMLEAQILRHYDNIEEWYRVPTEKFVKVFENVPPIHRWVSGWLENRTYNDFWKQPGFNSEEHLAEYPDIPMFIMGAWYDFFLRGTLNNFVGLKNLQRSPKFMLITPTIHGPGPARLPWQGEVHMGEQSTVEWNRLRLSFFDQFLKDIDTGCYDESWAKMFVMGGGDGSAIDVGQEELSLNDYARWSSEPATEGRRLKISHGGRWIDAPGWPVEPVTPTPFYLHAGGGLSTVAPDGEAEPTRYEFDPRNPVPQIGGDWTHRRQFAGNPGLVSAEGGHFAAPGPRDQVARRNWFGCTDEMPLWTRPDVLSFSTEPLTEAVEVVGEMRVILYASSSAVDTDFTFKLIDEFPPNPDYPNGFAMLVHDGIIRARFRDSFEREELMEPGTVYRFDVDFWATANRFEVGHRLRLDISSSNFPSFDVNPNTGEPIGRHTHMVVATNRVFHDAGHQSHILLPIHSA
jgi:uncharacterized protein